MNQLGFWLKCALYFKKVTDWQWQTFHNKPCQMTNGKTETLKYFMLPVRNESDM